MPSGAMLRAKSKCGLSDLCDTLLVTPVWLLRLADSLWQVHVFKNNPSAKPTANRLPPPSLVTLSLSPSRYGLESFDLLEVGISIHSSKYAMEDRQSVREGRGRTVRLTHLRRHPMIPITNVVTDKAELVRG
jgi:hypothetical protein